MGAHTYWYFTGYQPEINLALQALRQREFELGRYNPAVSFPFDLDADKTIPGVPYSSISMAMEAAEESGTRSILDISEVTNFPKMGATSPLSTNALLKLFRTVKPTHELVELAILKGQIDTSEEFWGSINRGESRYIVIYSNNEPAEIFFAGYSYD